MSAFVFATGPDGKYAFEPDNSGSKVRERLPQPLRRRLYVLEADGAVQAPELDRLLQWARARAAEAWFRGPLVRRKLERFRDAQGALGRFRRVGREMRRALKSRKLNRLLRDVEEHFCDLAGSPLPLTWDNGKLVNIGRSQPRRPPEKWKERATRELRLVLPQKLAARVVTEIGRDVARR